MVKLRKLTSRSFRLRLSPAGERSGGWFEGHDRGVGTAQVVFLVSLSLSLKVRECVRTWLGGWVGGWCVGECFFSRKHREGFFRAEPADPTT